MSLSDYRTPFSGHHDYEKQSRRTLQSQSDDHYHEYSLRRPSFIHVDMSLFSYKHRSKLFGTQVDLDPEV